MIVTIWRHGEAENAAVDRLRELTDSGRDDVGFGCHQFNQACEIRNVAHPHRILHSSWVRASQTAMIIAAFFTDATLSVEQALQPDSNVAAVDAALFEIVDSGAVQEHIVLVSHQPLVSRLAEHYLGGSASVPFLPPGGLVTLSLNVLAPTSSTLLFWAFPPEYEAGV